MAGAEDPTGKTRPEGRLRGRRAPIRRASRPSKDLCLYPKKATSGFENLAPPLSGEGSQWGKEAGAAAPGRRVLKSQGTGRGAPSPPPGARGGANSPAVPPTAPPGRRHAGETPPPSLVGPGWGHLTQSGQSSRWQGPGPRALPRCEARTNQLAGGGKGRLGFPGLTNGGRQQVED